MTLLLTIRFEEYASGFVLRETIAWSFALTQYRDIWLNNVTGNATRDVCDGATDLGDGLVLRRGVAPAAGAYRIRGPDAQEYAVLNHLAVRDPTKCQARICELNEDACPSASCTVNADKKCVPR